MVTSVLTRAVARLLLAPTFVLAIAVLVRGYSDVGDGFAAGVIIALGVLMQYAAFGRAAVEATIPVRHAPVLAVVGLLLALAVAFVPTAFGRAPLQHVPDPDAAVVYVGSLELATALLFDAAIMLLVVGVMVAVIHGLARADEGDDDELLEPQR